MVQCPFMIASFAYPAFAKRMMAPSHPTRDLCRNPFDILGFTLAHIGIVIVLVGLIFPVIFNYVICQEEDSPVDSDKTESEKLVLFLEDSEEEDVESFNKDSTPEKRDLDMLLITKGSTAN